MTTYPQKITFGEMRESGVRDVLIHYCDYRCGHHTGAACPVSGSPALAARCRASV
jgi:hypothetical protein